MHKMTGYAPQSGAFIEVQGETTADCVAAFREAEELAEGVHYQVVALLEVDMPANHVPRKVAVTACAAIIASVEHRPVSVYELGADRSIDTPIVSIPDPINA